jgi:serine/threonine protein kinase
MAAGYQKLNLLGKGGAAVVWLAKHIETGQNVAVKQFPKKGDTSSVQLELEIASRIFESGVTASQYPGIKHISALLDEVKDKQDYWLTYELGGPNLTKNLFDVKGEFHKGERVYRVSHNDFYFALKENRAVLKDFLSKMLLVFDLL